jgi:ribonuclease P protein component
MLSKEFRLNKQNIESVYKKGRTFRENFFQVRFLRNNTEHWRFAIVIPKKIAAKATKRSRLKSKTFALLEEILKENKIASYDIILSFKQLPDENDIKPALPKVLARIS